MTDASDKKTATPAKPVAIAPEVLEASKPTLWERIEKLLPDPPAWLQSRDTIFTSDAATHTSGPAQASAFDTLSKEQKAAVAWKADLSVQREQVSGNANARENSDLLRQVTRENYAKLPPELLSVVVKQFNDPKQKALEEAQAKAPQDVTGCGVYNPTCEMPSGHTVPFSTAGKPNVIMKTR